VENRGKPRLFGNRRDAAWVFLLVWYVLNRLPYLLVRIPQVQPEIVDGDFVLLQVIDDLLQCVLIQPTDRFCVVATVCVPPTQPREEGMGIRGWALLPAAGKEDVA